MGIFSRRADRELQLSEQLYQATGNNELLVERLTELEDELDESWTRLSVEGAQEFSRPGLRKIIQLARIMYLKNPLIQRAVTVQAVYTWAQGAEPETEDDTVNEVIQRFLDDKGNRRAFWGEQARLLNDVTLANDGNLFFALFPNVITGHVRIRTVPVDEVQDIICNPNDRSEPWFYRREWTQTEYTADGRTTSTPMKALHPAMHFQPTLRPATFGGLPVMWDAPIYHMKVGGLAGMRFGVPETYAAHSWARAYKSFLEDWASLVKSLSRFAWRVTTKNKKVATTRQRLNSTLTTDSRESNPPPATGAAFVGDDQINIDAIPKTGATTSAEDGKQLRLMVASAMNIPDTLLSGDVDQGNLATAKTLDRPTELKFLSRQGMWKEACEDLFAFVVAASVRATRGRLSGTVTVDADGLEEIALANGADPSVTVKFPPILADDKVEKITAIVTAATLDGKQNANTIPSETLSLMLLTALGEDDIDEILDKLTTEKDAAEAEGITTPVVDALKEAVRELRESRARGMTVTPEVALVEAVVKAERTTRKLSVVLPLEHKLRRAFAKYWARQGKAVLVTLARYAPDFPELVEAIDPTKLDTAIGHSVIADPALAQLVQIVAESAMEGGASSAEVDLSIEASFSVSHPQAVEWLRSYGANKVSEIDDVTRRYLRTIVTQAADEGWSYQRTAGVIKDRFVEFAVGAPQDFIRSRAELVAVTEVGTAYEKGASIVAADLQAQGLVIEKAWLDVGDGDECEDCLGNAEDGWIDESDSYSDGSDEPPSHPGCRCTNERRVGDEVIDDGGD